jgi:hypothetical protein
VYKHTCLLSLDLFRPVHCQSDPSAQPYAPQDAKGHGALRWNETFAFLAGGNVRASEALELQLKHTVRLCM